MLKLLSFAPGFGEPSASAFCVKSMCDLTMAGLDWAPDFAADPRKAPKKKLPVLIDGEKVIADSGAIRDHLRARYGHDPDKGLSEGERAVAHAVTRMVEEHLYFAGVYDRWARDDNFALVRNAFFSNLPAPLRALVPWLVRRQILAAMHGQGMSRHSEAEIAARARADVGAIVALLGDRPFLFGDRPTGADAAVGPMLSALGGGPNDTPCRAAVAGNPAAMAYVGRVRAAIYPDLAAS